MDKNDLIKKLCQLATLVGDKHFGNRRAHDCFCEDSETQRLLMNHFQFEHEVLEFIERAVEEKIARAQESRLDKYTMD